MRGHWRLLLAKRLDLLSAIRQIRGASGPVGRDFGGTVKLRTWARVIIASTCFLSGLVETLSATGLVIEVSPDARWGAGVQTLALGGPLQMAAAALLASGRKTRWALVILLCYFSLGSVFSNLPRIPDPDVGGSAIAGLLINGAVIGGLLYWLNGERTRGRSVLSLTGNTLHGGRPPVQRARL